MIRAVLFGTHPKYYWLSMLLFLGVLTVVLISWSKLDPGLKEGFQQESPYVYLSKDQVYDDPVYVSMYDRLMLPQDVLDNVVGQVVELTQPSKMHSTILDLGSGTGLTAATLARKGYTVYGVDKSPTMVKHAKSKYDEIPTLQFKEADWSDPMLWEPNSFTHILFTGFSLYLLDSKTLQRRLLDHCFHWLKPGGYLVVQLADAAKFSAIVPGGRPPVPVQSRERIVNTVIDYVDFEYKAGFTFPAADQVVLKESFSDAGRVRDLEQTFYMPSVKDVLTLAVQAGFAGQGYANLKHDPHQYLYVFVKPA